MCACINCGTFSAENVSVTIGTGCSHQVTWVDSCVPCLSWHVVCHHLILNSFWHWVTMQCKVHGIWSLRNWVVPSCSTTYWSFLPPLWPQTRYSPSSKPHLCLILTAKTCSFSEKTSICWGFTQVRINFSEWSLFVLVHLYRCIKAPGTKEFIENTNVFLSGGVGVTESSRSRHQQIPVCWVPGLCFHTAASSRGDECNILTW